MRRIQAFILIFALVACGTAQTPADDQRAILDLMLARVVRVQARPTPLTASRRKQTRARPCDRSSRVTYASTNDGARSRAAGQPSPIRRCAAPPAPPAAPTARPCSARSERNLAGAFAPRRPGRRCHGTLVFSTPSIQGDVAFIEQVHFCDPLCFSGTLYALRRERGICAFTHCCGYGRHDAQSRERSRPCFPPAIVRDLSEDR